MGERRLKNYAEDWMTEEGLLLLRCWRRDGATLDDISKKTGIPVPTLSNWSRKHPEIGEALSAGKEVVDFKVESALLKAALGYKSVETKVIVTKKNGEIVEQRKEKVEKEVGPNVTACLAWLNNRCSKKWKRNADSIIEADDESNGITIKVIKQSAGHDEDEEWNDADE